MAADWFLDATETGALLPLAGAEHVTGFESRARTGEPHAPGAGAAGQPPARHGLLRARPPRGRGPHDRAARRGTTFAALLLGRRRTRRRCRPVARRLVPNPPGEDPLAIGPDFGDPDLDKDLWRFRRIAARGLFAPGAYPSDITLVNWPQVDYTDAVVLDGPRRRRPRAQPRVPVLDAGRAGLPRAAAARRRGRRRRPTGSPRRRTSARRGGIRAAAHRGGAGHRARGARPPRRGRATTTRRASATTASTCIPRPAAIPTSTSPCCPFQLPLGALVPERVDQPARRRQGDGHDAHHQRRLPPAPGGVERGRGRRPPRGLLPRATAPRRTRWRGAPRGAAGASSTAAGIERAWPEEIRAPGMRDARQQGHTGMRVLVTTTGGAGHFGPLVPSPTPPLAAGDEVMVAVARVPARTGSAPPGYDVWPVGRPAGRRARRRVRRDRRAAGRRGQRPGRRRRSSPGWTRARRCRRAGRLRRWRPGPRAVGVVRVRRPARRRAPGHSRRHRRHRAAIGRAARHGADVARRSRSCAASSGCAPAAARARRTYVTLTPAAAGGPRAPGPPGAPAFRENDGPAPARCRTGGTAPRPLVYVTFGSVAPQTARSSPGLYRAAIEPSRRCRCGCW